MGTGLEKVGREGEEKKGNTLSPKYMVALRHVLLCMGGVLGIYLMLFLMLRPRKPVQDK